MFSVVLARDDVGFVGGLFELVNGKQSEYCASEYHQHNCQLDQAVAMLVCADLSTDRRSMHRFYRHMGVRD
jgi:hypothetical protein